MINNEENMTNCFDNTFCSYLNKMNIYNLHSSKEESYKKLPDVISDMPNIICYGAPGLGKYSQALKIIEKYSPSKLKYEKKVHIQLPKNETYLLKISDIHFEIDIETLGCNGKTLWQTIYNGIFDILSQNNTLMFSSKSNTKSEYNGIILCKNFHHISNELLDVFYSYMVNVRDKYNVRFILLTESLSFIYKHILDICVIYNYSRPNKTQYAEAVSKTTNVNYKKIYSKLTEPSNIINIENEMQSVVQFDYCNKLCSPIIEMIIQNNVDYNSLRDAIYTIMIHNLSIDRVIYYLLYYIFDANLIPMERMNICLQNIYSFYKLYNNNYRPIFHLEKFVLELVRIINDV